MDSPSGSPVLPRKICRPPLWWTKLPLAGLTLSLAGATIVLTLSSAFSSDLITTNFVVRIGGALFFGLLLVGVAVLLALDSIQTRLVVSATGIEYYGPAYTIYAQWSDVERIWTHWYEAVRFWYWPSLPEKLILRRSQLRANRWIAAWLRFNGRDRLIPVGEFALAWRKSELGDIIQYYVPHLDLHAEDHR